jgi:hypothetical protein
LSLRLSDQLSPAYKRRAFSSYVTCKPNQHLHIKQLHSNINFLSRHGTTNPSQEQYIRTNTMPEAKVGLEIDGGTEVKMAFGTTQHAGPTTATEEDLSGQLP